jgi:methyl-accepting chemotaxis protein
MSRFSSPRRLSFFSFALGALVPSLVLMLAPLPALWASLFTVALLAFAFPVAFLFAGKDVFAPPLAQQESVEETATETKEAAAREEALLRKAAQLMALTEEHQKKATLSTSAAARATENATIIASAIEEMNAAISEIGHQADDASAKADDAVNKTKTAMLSVETLSTKSDEILSIVALIQKIAKHTNLLALNATIEAARAGEHGKGFAVVAQEVKALARQTSEATEQIEFQINNVRDASSAVTNNMREIESAISEIDNTILTIKTSLHEETQAVQEISRSAQETTNATKEVTDGISHMLVTTEEIRSEVLDLKGENTETPLPAHTPQQKHVVPMPNRKAPQAHLKPAAGLPRKETGTP